MVESSTYFHSSTLGMSSSLIIIMKNQGPNLVPWGPLLGHHVTLKNSLEQVSSAAFDNTGSQDNPRDGGFMNVKKAMLLNLYISHDQQDQMPFENQMTQWPCSGPWHYSMHMSLMSASVVFDPGVVPNCLGSTFTKTPGFTYCLTTNSSATFDSTGVREIGRKCKDCSSRTSANK